MSASYSLFSKSDVFAEICCGAVTDGMFDYAIKVCRQLVNDSPRPTNLNVVIPPLSSFINFLTKKSRVNAAVFLSSIVYMNKVKAKIGLKCHGMACTPHRIFLATLILATKMLYDSPLSNKTWKNLCLLFSLEEICLMERQLLHLLVEVKEEEIRACLISCEVQTFPWNPELAVDFGDFIHDKPYQFKISEQYLLGSFPYLSPISFPDDTAPHVSCNMDIAFLGTSSAQPNPSRSHSSLALRINGDVWIFDCGEGTQHQAIKLNSIAHKQSPVLLDDKSPYRPRMFDPIKFGKIEKIFITHMHGDHVFGLPGFLCTITQNASFAKDDGRIIDIYGPLPLRSFLRSALESTRSRLGCRYRVNLLLKSGEFDHIQNYHPDELIGQDIYQDPSGTWTVFENEKLLVRARSIYHSIPSLGFVVEEAPVPGRLLIEQLNPILEEYTEAFKAAGITNPKILLGKIKSGQDIQLPDGNILKSGDYVLPNKPGRKIVILGDTYDATNIAPLAMNADVVIHEATNAYIPPERFPHVKLDSIQEAESNYAQVEQTSRAHGHSTPQIAAKFARNSNAKCLVLNHFSSRYKGDDSQESQDVMNAFKELAIDVFESDRVFTARDFMSLTVPRPSS